MIKLEQFEKLEDYEIIEKILEGETALYEIIIRRYNPYLFKVGMSYGFVHSDTEDLMQEAYINAYTNLANFENRASVKTWLVKIMINQCYHKKQKFSYKNEIPSDSLEKKNVDPMFSHNSSNPGKTVMNNELKHILESALLDIPEKYKMVFTLRELNEMSVKETAEALNISESNVKIRLKRAKGMLRTEIQKMYSPEEIFEFNLIYCNRIVDNVFQNLNQKDRMFGTYFNFKQLQKRFLSWFNLNIENPSNN